MVQKQDKKALKKKKKKHTEELSTFEKMSVSDSDQVSINSSSSEEDEVRKLDSGAIFTWNTNRSSKNIKQPISTCNLDALTLAISHSNTDKNNNNFKSSAQELIPVDKIHKKDSKNMSVLRNYVNSTSRYVKILMDSGASALIIHNFFVCKNKFNTRKTSKLKLID